MKMPDLNKLFHPEYTTGSTTDNFRRWFYALWLELHPATSGCGPCSNYMLSLETRGEHSVQPDIEIDVIYTWVDGSDPEHVKKRNHYMGKQDNIHENAVDLARFRDNDELRFSLRAIEQFAPWVRKIILVTAGQCPDWVDRNHPRLRIVDHTDFIPEKYLPTFNSHVIEAYLHEIPGLSEHFLYLNDDVFLGRPCQKSFFFTSNKLPIAFVDWRKRRRFGYSYTKTPHAMSYFNTLNLLEKKGIPTDPCFITAHGPYAQTKANARDAFACFKETIEAFAPNRFRTTDEIAMYCHGIPLWAYYKKRIIPCDERYYYVQTMRRDRVAYYKAILHSYKDHVPPIFFCINDVGRSNDVGPWRKDLQTLLTTYFPHPSGFEALPLKNPLIPTN